VLPLPAPVAVIRQQAMPSLHHASATTAAAAAAAIAHGKEFFYLDAERFNLATQVEKWGAANHPPLMVLWIKYAR
jgi:hypothetical protein